MIWERSRLERRKELLIQSLKRKNINLKKAAPLMKCEPNNGGATMEDPAAAGAGAGAGLSDFPTPRPVQLQLPYTWQV